MGCQNTGWILNDENGSWNEKMLLYAVKQSPHRLLAAAACAVVLVLLATTGSTMPGGGGETPPPPIGLPVEMVYIQGGTFTMGDYSGYNDEKPEHLVTVSGFKMGKYEVTQKQYEQVMGKNPSYFQGDIWEAAGGEVRGSWPVEKVSWLDAVKFCNALSQKERKTPAYTINDESKLDVSWNKSADGYRLPTEAEWEYACRAGTHTQWSFGDDGRDMDGYGWYSGNDGTGFNGIDKYGTHAVGKKKANGNGLYDMHGNVFEWCWDRYGYDYYRSGDQTDPDGAASGSSRVLRGGSWLDSASWARSAYRSSNSAGYYSVGFRLVCD